MIGKDKNSSHICERFILAKESCPYLNRYDNMERFIFIRRNARITSGTRKRFYKCKYSSLSKASRLVLTKVFRGIKIMSIIKRTVIYFEILSSSSYFGSSFSHKNLTNMPDITQTIE